jgi:predicted nuclease of predicted toxin-antitoxin system
MRLLLDESVPVRLQRHLKGHSVRTVVEMNWLGVRNGQLLALAGQEFDAFVTVDKNIQYQQNLAKLPLAVVVLDARSNDLPVLLELLPKLEAALLALEPKTLVRVSA